MSLTPWAKAGPISWGNPGAVTLSAPHSLAPQSRTPCQLLAAPAACANSSLCADVCVCVCTRACGQDTGGGPSMGHLAAGEAQSTALSQGDRPTVPAPMAAVLLRLRMVCGQRLDPLPCWGHQSQGRTPGASASGQNRRKKPSHVRPAVQPLDPGSSSLTSPLSKGSFPGPQRSILLHCCVSNLLQRQ